MREVTETAGQGLREVVVGLSAYAHYEGPPRTTHQPSDPKETL